MDSETPVKKVKKIIKMKRKLKRKVKKTPVSDAISSSSPVEKSEKKDITKNECKIPITREEQEEKYLSSLNEKELQAYEIAKKHLGSSFSLYRSIGFKGFN